MTQRWRLPRHTPIGVDVGSRHIKAIQFCDGPHGRVVSAAARFARLIPDGPLDGREARRLAETLDRQGFNGTRVVLAAPPGSLTSAPLEIPPRNAEISLAPIVRNEVCRIHKLDPGGIEVAHWEIPPPARAPRSTHLIAAACAREAAEHVFETLAAVDLELVGLDVPAWAMARGCAAATVDAAAIVPILDLGWNAATLVVLHRNTVVFERGVTDAGLHRLHQALTSQLRLDAELTERLLANPSALEVRPLTRAAARQTAGVIAGIAAAEDGAPSTAVMEEEPELPAEVTGTAQDAMHVHVDRLAGEVRASLTYVSQRYPDAAASAALLIGGGAMLAGAIGQLEAALGFSCTTVTPLAGANCAEPALARRCTPDLTLAAGLALFETSC